MSARSVTKTLIKLVVPHPIRESQMIVRWMAARQFSIRWLLHGVRTISFEPNANCHSYLQMLCFKNGVGCEIAPVAFGSWEGTATLSFSPGEEWLGTTRGHGREFPQHIEVCQRT